MEPNFEQNIPIPFLIGGFVFLMIISTKLRQYFRNKKLIKEGQINTDGGRVPTLDERLAGNPAWNKGEIHSKGRNFMLVLWLVAIVLNLTLGLSFIKSISNPEIPIGGKIILGIFSLFGVGFVIYAARVTIRFFKYGESVCVITGRAGILNKQMTGLIRNKNEINPKGDYEISLQCIETYSTGSGKNRRTETKIHWKSTIKVPAPGTSSRMGIPFSFDLPKFAPETGYQISRGDINWQIFIEAPTNGISYSAVFVVPVFNMEGNN